MLLNRRLRTIPNMFVASLAVSDFSIGALTSVPLGIPTLVTSHWPFNDATCQFQGYIVMALVAASVHTLALMAVNRYFRIVKPSKYRRYFTKKKTMMIPPGVVVLFHLLSITIFLGWTQNSFSCFQVLLYSYR